MELLCSFKGCPNPSREVCSSYYRLSHVSDGLFWQAGKGILIAQRVEPVPYQPTNATVPL